MVSGCHHNQGVILTLMIPIHSELLSFFYFVCCKLESIAVQKSQVKSSSVTFEDR